MQIKNARYAPAISIKSESLYHFYLLFKLHSVKRKNNLSLACDPPGCTIPSRRLHVQGKIPSSERVSHFKARERLPPKKDYSHQYGQLYGACGKQRY